MAPEIRVHTIAAERATARSAAAFGQLPTRRGDALSHVDGTPPAQIETAPMKPVGR